MEKEVKLQNRTANKLFLIILKFILHILGMLYVIYTLLGFIGIDAVIISYFAHVSIFPWIVLYMLSKRFYFCYVHRLPLYYIAANELITVGDYYLGVPNDYFRPLVIHIILLGLLIIGYSYYYLKFRLNK